MKEMRSKAIVVLVNSKKGDFSKMPMPVREELSKSELGNMIPRMAVFDKNSEKALGSLAYKQIGDKRAMRELENAMRDYIKNGAKSSAEESDSDSDDSPGEDEAESTSSSKLGENGEIEDADMMVWTSSKGTKIKARATHFKDGKLSLLRSNGTTIRVTMDQLDAAGRERAKELIGE